MSKVSPRVNISKSTHDRHKREITRLRAENEKLRARSVLIPESVQKIIDDYPAVCAERDRMRKRLDKAHGFISRADWAQFFQEEHEDARDAIKGVTEPAR